MAEGVKVAEGYGHQGVEASPMVTVTLMNVDQCGGMDVLRAARAWVDAAGGTCSYEIQGGRLRLAIQAPTGLADLIADGLIEWYDERRRNVRLGFTAGLPPLVSARC